MTIRLSIADRDGRLHEIEAPPAGTLMELLRDRDLGVAAVCGGLCSCATCHVYLAPEWMERLAPAHGDERDIVAGLLHGRETSRLACQIALCVQLHGLHVTVAPEE